MENIYRFLKFNGISAKKPAGVDEVGRGPIAGPLVACALYIPEGVTIGKINDSKLLNPEERNKILKKMFKKGIKFGIGFCFNKEIDKVGIREATFIAMRRAIKNLPLKCDFILVDGFKIEKIKIPQIALTKGDRRIDAIAGASILAKVYRDMWMIAISNSFPEYRFDQHKGYPTSYHLEMLLKLGPTPIHRRTFAPLKGGN